MCGIVGYIGSKNAIEVIMDGLKRLEYRGYDSAGICFLDANHKVEILKKSGRLGNLSELIKKASPFSNIGIGHTRWATHGGVTDSNAHPHGNDTIYMVHNGIIENAMELKEELIKEGHSFKSETDSEVFLVLVTKYYKQNQDLKKAVSTAFKIITGNSAFVVMTKDANEIITVKRGAPIVCGQSKATGETFVSSDPYALVGYADTLYFPEDETLCHLEDEKLLFYDLDGNESKKYLVQNQEMDLEISDKGQFDHYMIKEIHEQPGLIREFSYYYLQSEGMKHLEHFNGLTPKGVHISACGTAWHAGLVIKNFIEKTNKIPCYIDLASEFRYRDPLLNDDEIGLFISQSGETADTLAAQQLCKKRGIKTVSIVNVAGSTLYRDCDYNLLIKAGAEIGVASTKAFTLQALTGLLLSQAMKGKFDKDGLQKKLTLLASRIENILDNIDEIKKIADEIYKMKGFIFTGRGIYFPVALEGALKLKEIAYVHAEGYAAGELKHGPIALIDDSMVNVAIVGPELYEKARSNVEEVKARKGVILTIGPENDSALMKLSNFYIPMNFNGLDELSPLLANVALQLLSYFVAKNKGTDIDKPRNLAKSVTVE